MLCCVLEKGKKREKWKNGKMKINEKKKRKILKTPTRSKVMMGGRGVGSIGSWAELVGVGEGEGEGEPASKKSGQERASTRSMW